MQKRSKRRADREYLDLYQELDQDRGQKIVAFEKIKHRKKKAKRKIRRQRMGYALVVIAIVLYFLSPWSRIQTIVVYNNTLLTTEHIIAQSGVDVTKSATVFTWKYFINKKLQENPFISYANVNKTWRGSVSIEVKEKRIIYKTIKDNQAIAYFEDGTAAIIPEEYQVITTTLSGVTDESKFPYQELALKLAAVPPEIVEEISEIKHTPSNISNDRYTFYMKDRNRVIILLHNIDTKLKYYFKLVEQSDGQRLEYIIEYLDRGVIGKKI